MLVGDYLTYETKANQSGVNFEKILENKKTLCQFILDPTSFNLHECIHMSDPVLDQLYKLSRDYCFAVSSARMAILKTKEQNT